MKRRRLILGSATLLGVTLLFAYLFLPEEAALSSSFVSGQRGRWGNFRSDDDYSIMWVTNNASISFGLEDQIVQFERGGIVSTDAGTSWVSWDGKDGPIYNLPAKSVASLPFEVLKDATRFRVLFRYSRSGGRLRKALGGFLRKLPYNRLSPALQSWLLMNGLIDGRIRRQIEGPWMPKEPAAGQRPLSLSVRFGCPWPGVPERGRQLVASPRAPYERTIYSLITNS